MAIVVHFDIQDPPASQFIRKFIHFATFAGRYKCLAGRLPNQGIQGNRGKIWEARQALKFQGIRPTLETIREIACLCFFNKSISLCAEKLPRNNSAYNEPFKSFRNESLLLHSERECP